MTTLLFSCEKNKFCRCEKAVLHWVKRCQSCSLQTQILLVEHSMKEHQSNVNCPESCNISRKIGKMLLRVNKEVLHRVTLATNSKTFQLKNSSYVEKGLVSGFDYR